MTPTKYVDLVKRAACIEARPTKLERKIEVRLARLVHFEADVKHSHSDVDGSHDEVDLAITASA